MMNAAKPIKQRSGGAELPLESAWCCVCRRSSDVKWTKHAFTKSHQQRAAEFLKQRSTALLELLVIPSDDGGNSSAGVLQTLAARKWSCGFCEIIECVAGVVMRICGACFCV